MLIIKKEFKDKMIAHSNEEFPNEACGILAGKGGCVKKLYRMTNAEKSPQTFFMDAKEQFKAMKDTRASGLEMIGIYHSHVASQPYPSSHDVEMAFYPDASYVIVSLQDKDNPGIRSFKIKEAKIEEEEVKIE